jgi:hypothetical protein
MFVLSTLTKQINNTAGILLSEKLYCHFAGLLIAIFRLCYFRNFELLNPPSFW